MESIINSSTDPSGQREESSATANVSPNVLVEGNVTRVEAVETQETYADSSTADVFPELSSSEPLYYDECVLERFFRYGSYTWKASMSPNEQVCEIDFMTDLLEKDELANSIFRIPFKKHRFFKTDLVIRVEINSTRFHVGALVGGFYYQAGNDDDYLARRNIASIQLLPHFVLYASQSNPGEILIPFKNVHAMLSTRKLGDVRYASIGTFQLLVLNKLVVPSQAMDELSVLVSFSLRNSVFSGMIAPDVMTQMDPATIALATMAIKELNRDMPPNYAPPTNMRLQQGSMSHGIGEGPTMSQLRLRGCVLDPLPAGCMVDPTCSKIGNIAQLFGFMRTVIWKSANATGTTLLSFPIRAVLYDWLLTNVALKVNSAQSIDAIVLPPVNYVSAMHVFRRGTYTLRFNIVGSPFHSGRLLVAYFPRYKGTVPTLEQAFSGVHSVFDIGEQREFFFRVPYVNNTPWSIIEENEFRYHHREVSDPCVVAIFVLNKLVYMEDIPQEVGINMYIAGGPDFEVAVPCAPSYGLSWNLTNTSNKGGDIVWRSRTSDSDQFILSNTDSIYDGKVCVLDTYEGIFPNKDIEFEFPKMAVYTPPYTKTGSTYNFKWHVTWVKAEGTEVNITYFVPYPNHRNIFLGVIDEPTGTEFVKTKEKSKLLQFNGNSIQVADVPEKDQFLVKWGTEPPVTCQMPAPDPRAAVDPSQLTTGMLKSTEAGQKIFGESFDDLKNVCRRFQHYTSFELNASSSWERGGAMFAFPVLPQGLAIDDTNDPVSVNCREGIIPYVTSAFRYGRGGIKFMIFFEEMIQNYLASHSVFYVEHRPDFLFVDNRILKASELVGSRAYHGSGYASEVQYTLVNNVMEFTIPFYNSSRAVVLQEPKVDGFSDEMNLFKSLGVVLVGCYDKPQNMNVTIKYAFDDDFELGTFVGAPPVVHLYDFDSARSSVDELRDAQRDGWVTQMETQFEPITTAAAGVGGVSLAAAAYSIRKGVKQLKKLRKRVDVVTTDIKDSVESTSARVLDVVEDLLGSGGTDEPTTLIDKVLCHLAKMNISVTKEIINFVSQLCHCIINPKPGTIAISVVTMLLNVGLIGIEMYAQVKDLLERMFEYCSGLFSSERGGEGAFSTQAGPADFVPQFVGILFLGFCSIANVTMSPPSKYPNCFVGMMDSIKNVSSGANHVITFMRSTLSGVTSFWEWFELYRQPKFALVGCLESEQEIIQVWSKACFIITEPNLYETVKKSPKMVADVFRLTVIGDILALKIAVDEMKPKAGFFIKSVNHRIQTLRDRLASELRSPAARYEPFVVAFAGPSNVGKSFLMGEFVVDLLESIDYKTSEEAIYYRPINNKFWNNLSGQPGLIIDEVLGVKGERGAEQIAEIMNLKSSAIFNPAKAHVDDKDIRYNPLVFGMCMNDPFPVHSELSDTVAFYRRRNLLFKVSKRPEFKGTEIIDIPSEVKDAFGHLQFEQYLDPADTKTKLGPVLKYDEMKKLATERFDRYHADELKNYYRRLKNLTRLAPDTANVASSISDNYANISRKITEMLNNLDKDNNFREMLKSYEPEVRFDEGAFAKIRREVVHDVVDHLEGMEYLDGLAPEQPFETQGPRAITKEDELFIPPFMYKKEKDGKTRVCHSGVNDLIIRLTSFCADKKLPEEPEYLTLKRCTYNFSLASIVDVFVKEKEKVSTCPHGQLKFDWPYDDKTFRKVNVFGDDEVMHNVDHPMYKKCDNCYLEKKEAGYYWLLWCAHNINDVGHYVMDDRFAKNIPVQVRVLLSIPVVLGFLRLIPVSANSGTSKIQKVDEAILSKIKIEDRLKCWRDMFTSQMKEVWKLIKKWKWVVAAVGLVASGYALYQRFRRGPREIESQYTSSGDPKTRSSNKPSSKIVIDSFAGPFKTQASENKLEVVTRAICRNTFFLILRNKNRGDSNYMRCLGLSANFAVVLSHYVKYISYQLDQNPEGFELLYQHSSGVPLPINFSDITLHRSSGSDIWLMALPERRIPPFRSLWGHLSPFATVASVSSACNLITVNTYGTTHQRLTVRQFEQKVAAVAGIQGRTVNIHGGFEYGYGGPGLCGSVLVDITKECPIVGIHVAGTGTRLGASEFLYRDMFTKVIPQFAYRAGHITAERLGECSTNDKSSVRTLDGTNGTVEQPSADEGQAVYLSVPEDIIFPDGIFDDSRYDAGRDRFAGLTGQCGSYEYGGILQEQFVVHQPNTTSIRPSGIPYTELGLQCSFSEPAILNVRDPRNTTNGSPLFSGITNKLLVPRATIQGDVFETIVRDFESECLSKALPVRSACGVLPLSVAVTGIASIPEYKHIEFTTSEGFPLALLRPKGYHNKSWLFATDLADQGYKLRGIHTTLLQIMCIKHRQRQKMVLPFSPFLCFLKDERILKEKIGKPGSTRIIDACPVDLLIVLRQYYLDFVAAFQRARIDMPHAVGINQDSHEWKSLHDRMVSYGEYVLCGDYSKFGPRLIRQFVMAAYRIMNNWYEKFGNENELTRKIRAILMYENVDPWYVAANHIFRAYCGSPSGSPLTVIINSIVNILYIKYAVRCMFGQTVYWSMKFPLLRFYVYGDDIIIAVTAEQAAYLNNTTLSKFFAAKMDIKFTHVKKDELIEKERMSEMQFLKSGFKEVTHNGIVAVASPLDWRSVNDQIQWARKRRELTNEDLFELCQAFLNMVFHYGRDIYEQYLNRVIVYWRARGQVFYWKTYSEIFNQYYVLD